MRVISLIWIGIGVISIIQFFIEKELIYAAQSLVCSGVATILIWLANLKQEFNASKLRQEVILAKLDVIMIDKDNYPMQAISNNLPELMNEIRKSDCGKEIKIR